MNLATHFSFDELKKATDSFKDTIGDGAFGTVYLGTNIRNSGTTVAVKMLNEVLYKYVFYYLHKYYYNF